MWCRFRGEIKRPYITAWLDWRTRYATVILTESPSSTSILAALRAGILDEATCGGPSSAWIDNGKDWDCYSFHGQTKQQRRGLAAGYADNPVFMGLFKMLGIEPHFAQPYNPNGKARIERFFGIVHEQFDRTFPTYCGETSAARPEDLTDLLANRPRLIPTFEDVASRLRQWVAGYNANAERNVADLEGLSPEAAIRGWCNRRKVLSDPSVLNLLLQQWAKPCTVGRQGIAISPAGKYLTYGATDLNLMPFKAARKQDRPLLMVSYNPENFSTIRVFDSQWRFICEAKLNGVGGYHGDNAIKREHVKELIREKNAYKRSMKVIGTHRYDQLQSDAERLAVKAAAGARARRRTPPAIQVVKTPLDGVAKGIEQRRQRVAAYRALPQLDLLEAGRRLRASQPPPEEHEEELASFMRKFAPPHSIAWEEIEPFDLAGLALSDPSSPQRSFAPPDDAGSMLDTLEETA